jgi:hypothetical protein
MKRIRWVVRAFIFLGVVFGALLQEPSSVAQINDRIELASDLADPNQDGLLTFYGAAPRGGEIGLPVGAGDLNGDGRADVVFCEMYATMLGRNNCGLVNFCLSDGRDTGMIDLATSPPGVSTLIGRSPGDLLGMSVAGGDVNNDGFDDVVIGASGSDGPGNSRFNCGAAYVVFGSQDIDFHLDLLTPNGLPPAGITVIYGPQVSGRFGIWTAVGDLDGDGVGDIVVGADQVNSPAGNHVGAAYIVFGSEDLPQVIDLAAPPPGVRIARVLGAGAEYHTGAALQVGDVNNDGIGDLIVGASVNRDSAGYITPADREGGHEQAAASFGGTRPKCGEAYVVYGTNIWPEEIDLAAPPAATTHIIGADQFDFLGSQLHSADLNGDGKEDLIVGALLADSPDKVFTGAVYVFYGSPELVGATVDLAQPDPPNLHISRIFGENPFDCAGDSVRAFDINRDGKAELFVGSPENTFQLAGDPEPREEAGDTKIIFGRDGFLPPVIKLYDPPPGLQIFRLAGAKGESLLTGQGGDEMSYRLWGGDVDGDGYIDYIVNAMHGDGFGDLAINAGNVYVFSGKKLSERLGILPPTPEPAPELMSATLSLGGQNVSQAQAGQSGLRVTIDGLGFRDDTEVTISGLAAISHIPGDPQQAPTRRTVELDENPAIRNRVGPLLVSVRNTTPPSEQSAEISAGVLLGPEISSVAPKRKSSGVIVLKIKGSGFSSGSEARVDGPLGQVVIKATIFKSSSSLKAKIGASSAPPSGASLHVRVASATQILSNEAVVIAP